MLRLRLKTWVLGLLLLTGTVAYGQFQYFGIGEQLLSASKTGIQSVTTLGYLKQATAHHGFGVELGFPYLWKNDLSQSVTFDHDTLYQVGLIWKRQYLPSIAGRYRLFAGNHFFVGTSLALGLLRERFYADRYYNDSHLNADPIMPVYLDYKLLSPYLRLQLETGFIWNMGDRVYASLNGQAGIQFIKSRAPLLGSFVATKGNIHDFESLHGVEAFGGLAIGLGIKL